MSKASPWIAGINAVASALEHDAGNVREVLVEAAARLDRRFGQTENPEKLLALRARRHADGLNALDAEGFDQGFGHGGLWPK